MCLWKLPIVLGLVVLNGFAEEKVAGAVSMTGLRWAPESSSLVPVPPPPDANPASIEVIDFLASVKNQSGKSLSRMLAETRIRWQEGAAEAQMGTGTAVWTSWSLVDTRLLHVLYPHQTLQLRNRLDVEGRRKALERRKRWAYVLQVQLTLRDLDSGLPVLVKTGQVEFPRPAGHIASTDPE